MPRATTLLRRLLLPLALVLAAGCDGGGSTGVGDGEPLLVRSEARSLHITNRSGRPVYIFAVGRSLLPVINWAPCVDARYCPPLANGATRVISPPAYSDSEREVVVVVHWWHAVRRADGDWQPGPVRWRNVPL